VTLEGWLWALAAVFLLVLLFFLGDVVRWWLGESRLQAYSRSDSELLAYPAMLRELERKESEDGEDG
jgi:membrane protein implicated in regulation of membrane protease activity